MSVPPRRTHREVIEETLRLDGARVADIGCGDGALVRLMTRAGAHVIGIESSERQLVRARAAEPTGDEDYALAGAEALPLPDASLDIAVFFNSLHHVPAALQAKALDEAGRALRPGGLLYILEPIAAGRHFEITREIEDETEVRAKAYEVLQAAAEGPLFLAESELTYLAPVRYDSFEQLRDRLISVDERRRATVEALRDKLRQAFDAAAERRDGAYWFNQPRRLNLLRRSGA